MRTKRGIAKFIPQLLNVEKILHQSDGAPKLLNEINNDTDVYRFAIQMMKYGFAVMTLKIRRRYS